MRVIRKWLPLIIILFPFLVLLPLVNIITDPAGVFMDDSEEIAEAILSGEKPYVLSGNANERRMRQFMLRNLENADCFAVGSSVVMCVDQDMTGNALYYNLGESSADFYDILAEFAFMDIYGKMPSEIIFSVDTLFFDEENYEKDDNNKEYRPFSNYMIDKIEGKEPSIPEVDNYASLKIKMNRMFSVTYFQDAMFYIKNKGWDVMIDRIKGHRWGLVGEGDYEGEYYVPDGSIVYPKSVRDNTSEDVRKDCEKYGITPFSRDSELSEKSLRVFEELISYLVMHGVNVKLFLCPVAPSLWKRINNESEYPMLFRLESFTRDIAAKKGLTVIGSYNPDAFELKNSDFYDARHIRPETLKRCFEF